MRQSLHRLIKTYKETGTYTDFHCRKKDKKITQEMAIEINNELETNDETTARQLRSSLVEKYPGLEVLCPLSNAIENSWDGSVPDFITVN